LAASRIGFTAAVSHQSGSNKSNTAFPREDCDPSYPEVCLDPYAADYDCAGGSGDGPE
jgi:hypothetical protein